MKGLCLFGELLSNKGEHHAQAEEPEEVEEGQAGVRPFFFFCTKRCKDPAYTSYNHGWLSGEVVVLGTQPMEFAAIASFCTTGCKREKRYFDWRGFKEAQLRKRLWSSVNSLFLYNGTNNKWTIRNTLMWKKDFTFVTRFPLVKSSLFSWKKRKADLTEATNRNCSTLGLWIYMGLFACHWSRRLKFVWLRPSRGKKQVSGHCLSKKTSIELNFYLTCFSIILLFRRFMYHWNLSST